MQGLNLRVVCVHGPQPLARGEAETPSAYTNGALRVSTRNCIIPASVPQIKSRATGLIVTHSDWKY